jgi:hypothetical protein
MYSNCKTSKELEKTAEEYLNLEHERNEQKQKNKKNLGLPPNSSDEEKNNDSEEGK